MKFTLWPQVYKQRFRLKGNKARQKKVLCSLEVSILLKPIPY